MGERLPSQICSDLADESERDGRRWEKADDAIRFVRVRRMLK